MKIIRYAFVLSSFVVVSWAQHSTIPVVLVDGFNFGGCTAPVRTASTDFGLLGTILSQDSGSTTYYYDYCQRGLANASIDQIGADFGNALAALTVPYNEVDVVAYSMGGLIVRSYLAGITVSTLGINPVMSPPVSIRKLILISSPNWGALGPLSSIASLVGGITNAPQLADMLPGSLLLWDLNSWNQQIDDMRGVDPLAIAGDGDSLYKSDGVVSVNSASILLFGDQRTRVVGAYCHTNNPVISAATGCTGAGIAYVTDTTHPTYQAIRSFLDSTTAWESIGVSASQASGTGGFLWGGAYSATDDPLATGTPTLNTTALNAGAATWYSEFMPVSTSYTLNFTEGGQNWSQADIPIVAGGYWMMFTKSGPAISNAGIRPSAGSPPGALALAADALFTIYGQTLSSSTASAAYPWPNQLGDTTVTIDGVPCPLNYVSSGQVNALMPSALQPGAYGLMLSNSHGQDDFIIVIEPTVPAIFALPENAAAAEHASTGQVVSASNPAVAGEYIALYATGIGAVTQQGAYQVANQTPTVDVNGLPVTVSFAGRNPSYQGLDQINFVVPAGLPSGTSVPVQLITANRISNQVMLAVK